MREDNGVFRNFHYYKIEIAEMSIVLADYLSSAQSLCLAWSGAPSTTTRAPREAEALPSSMNTKLYAQTKMLNYTVRGHLCSRTSMPASSE